MASKNQKALIKKLKKQVRLLQSREKKSKNQLKTALKKIRKIGKSYKTRLLGKMRILKGKVDEARTSAYAKLATDLQRQLLKSIDTKGKALRAAIKKIEKKHISKLTKGIVKKGKKVGKAKAKKSKTSPPPKKLRRTVRRARKR